MNINKNDIFDKTNPPTSAQSKYPFSSFLGLPMVIGWVGKILFKSEISFIIGGGLTIIGGLIYIIYRNIKKKQ